MADNYGELMRYYKDFMSQFYGGQDYLSSAQETYFKEQADWMRGASKEMEGRSMENLAARGVMRSGVGTDYLARTVYDPLARAESALGSERARMIQTEKTRRQQQGLAMAIKRQQEEQERGAGIWGTLGSLAGAGIGLFASGGNPMGAVAGYQIGGQLGGAVGGGGGDGYDTETIAQMLAYMEQTNGQGAPTDFMNQESVQDILGAQYEYGGNQYTYHPAYTPLNPYWQTGGSHLYF